MALLLNPTAESRDLRARLLLLLGQALAFGILTALVVIGGNSLQPG